MLLSYFLLRWDGKNTFESVTFFKRHRALSNLVEGFDHLMKMRTSFGLYVNA